MRESVDSTTAIFMRFSKRRRKTEPNHPLGLRICAAMKCLSVTISPHRFGRCYLPLNCPRCVSLNSVDRGSSWFVAHRQLQSDQYLKSNCRVGGYSTAIGE